MARKIAKSLCIAYLACLGIFSVLLVAAFAIPTSLVQGNVEASVSTLSREGTYPRFVGTTPSWQADNYTTAVMLNIAAHGDSMGAYGAFSAFYYSDPAFEQRDDKLSSLKAGLALEADPSSNLWASYARYWNGWAVVLKPALVWLDLAGVRLANLVLLAVLAIVLCGVLARRLGLASLVPAAALLAVNAPVAMMSLSLAASINLALAACIAQVLLDKRLCAQPRMGAGLAGFFFVVGALTTYFDFLCTPLLTLGMPLVLHAALHRTDFAGVRGLGKGIARIAGVCLAWGAGYGLLWASKWLLSTIVCGWDVMADAGAAALFRTSSQALGSAHSALGVIRENLTIWLPLGALAAAAVAWLVLAVLALVRSARAGQAGNVAVCLVVLVAGLLPLAWYAALPNHSFTHAWYTYRDMAVTVQAALLALWALAPAGVRKGPAHAGGGHSTRTRRGQGAAVSGRQREREASEEVEFDEH